MSEDIQKQVTEIREILGGTMHEKGLVHVVRELVIITHGDSETSKIGLIDRMSQMEHKDDRRTGWISGAVWVAGLVGIGIGWAISYWHH